MRPRYFVLSGNALVVHRGGLNCQVLAGDPLKGGPDPKNGPVAFVGHAIPANEQDFSRFRVDPVGHIVCDFETFYRNFTAWDEPIPMTPAQAAHAIAARRADAWLAFCDAIAVGEMREQTNAEKAEQRKAAQ